MILILSPSWHHANIFREEHCKPIKSTFYRYRRIFFPPNFEGPRNAPGWFQTQEKLTLSKETRFFLHLSPKRNLTQFRTAIRLLSGTQPRERKFLHVRELHDRISLIAADRGACVYVEFYWMESISAVDITCACHVVLADHGDCARRVSVKFRKGSLLSVKNHRWSHGHR